tara:strand:- start:296 stop:514 length:219 start_codon:yes stop_codon:yes gene_type:complete
MIFRNKNDNKLVNIKRLEFLNDKEYIENILSVYSLDINFNNSFKEIETSAEEKDFFQLFLKKYDIPNIEREN